MDRSEYVIENLLSRWTWDGRDLRRLTEDQLRWNLRTIIISGGTVGHPYELEIERKTEVEDWEVEALMSDMFTAIKEVKRIEGRNKDKVNEEVRIGNNGKDNRSPSYQEILGQETSVEDLEIRRNGQKRLSEDHISGPENAKDGIDGHDSQVKHYGKQSHTDYASAELHTRPPAPVKHESVRQIKQLLSLFFRTGQNGWYSRNCHKCTIQQRVFLNEGECFQHLLNIHDYISCGICHQTFIRHELLKHWETEHRKVSTATLIMSWLCWECRIAFYIEGACLQHLQDKHNYSLCEICLKVFHSKDLLSEHKGTEHNEKPGSSSLDPRHSADQTLQPILKQQRGPLKQAEDSGSLVIRAEVRPLRIPPQWSTTQNDTPQEPTPEKQIFCPECDDTLLSDSFIEHMLEKHEYWLCVRCVAPFPFKLGLLSHLLILHSDELKYCCTICQSVTPVQYKETLSQHLESSHTDGRRYISSWGPQILKTCFLCYEALSVGDILQHFQFVHGYHMLEPYVFCDQLHCTMVFPMASVWSQHNTETHNKLATRIIAYSSRNCRNCSIVLSNPIELEQHKRAVHKCTRGTFSERMPYMTCGLCGWPRGSQEMVLWHLAIDHNDTRNYYGRFLQSMRSRSMIGFRQESIAQDATFQLQSSQRQEHMSQDPNGTDQIEDFQNEHKTFKTRIDRPSSQNLPRVSSGYYQDPKQNQPTTEHFKYHSSSNTPNSQPVPALPNNTQGENHRSEKSQSMQTNEPHPTHRLIGDMDRQISPISYVNGKHNIVQENSPRISTVSDIAAGGYSSPSMLHQSGSHNPTLPSGIRPKLVTRRYPSLGDAVPEYQPAEF